MTLLDLGQAETWRVSRSRLVASGHRRELRFARFLQDVGEPTALVLAAAVSRHTASEPGDARPVDSTSLRRAAAGARGALLELLALVRSDDRELANRAARAIVENVEHRPLSYRSRYNLACFYSAEDIELSLYYLRRALETAPPGERRSLARWAWSDPSLEATRSRARERVISLTSFAVPAQDIELLVDEYLHRGEDAQS